MDRIPGQLNIKSFVRKVPKLQFGGEQELNVFAVSGNGNVCTNIHNLSIRKKIRKSLNLSKTR
jgi:hypothetical protein